MKASEQMDCSGDAATEPAAQPAGDAPEAPDHSTVARLPSRPRIRTYEELDGADGRNVQFRPQRHSAEDLSPLVGTVRVTLGGQRRECALLDVSQNGAAIAWPREVPIQKRTRMVVSLRFDTHEVFCGEVVAGAVRPREDQTVVAFSFGDFLLDIDEILQLRDVRAWGDLGSALRVQDRKWGVAGGERFQARVSELRLLFEDARSQLAELEGRLPWHSLQTESGAPMTMMARSLRASFVPEVVRLSEEIDSAVRELPGGHANPAGREWSQRQLDEFLMLSPGLHRARHKPFGYPGDYEVMNFIYERFFEGGTLFARAVGLAFSEAISSRAVRYRKDLVVRQLRALLQTHAGRGRPLRVLSIASGPAQELYELFQAMDELPVPLEVVLFEQDRNALAHAWRRLKSVSDDRFSGRLQLTFLHDSIKRLLRDANLFREFGKFDLIYSCGLVDYLAPRTAAVLTRHLSHAAAPSGRLLIANMVDHRARWLLEHILEWPLIYKSREELLEVGRRAVPGAQARILEEESGANPFLELSLG